MKVLQWLRSQPPRESDVGSDVSAADNSSRAVDEMPSASAADDGNGAPVAEGTPAAGSRSGESGGGSSGKLSENARDRLLHKAIMASLYDAVIIVDKTGIVIAANGRADQLFGCNEGDLWALPCVKLVGAFNPRVFARIHYDTSGGRFMMLNANCTRVNGEVFPAEIAVSRIHYLNETDLLMSIRNLERRKMADERREMESCALNHAGIGLMLCRRSGEIEYTSTPLLRMLQIENEGQDIRHKLGDLCVSAEAVEKMLNAPSSTAAWAGSAMFRISTDRSAEFAVTSSCCPARKNGLDRVVISLMPAPGKFNPE